MTRSICLKRDKDTYLRIYIEFEPFPNVQKLSVYDELTREPWRAFACVVCYEILTLGPVLAPVVPAVIDVDFTSVPGKPSGAETPSNEWTVSKLQVFISIHLNLIT